MLPSLAAAAVLAAAPACPPHVADGHVVRAAGSHAFVKATKGGIRELVVRGVEPSAARHAVEAETTRCDVELKAFVEHFRTKPHVLHARLGRHAIRVQRLDYDPETKTLRTHGKLQRTPKRTRAALRASTVTEIVYASTFIPFDSSF